MDFDPTSHPHRRFNPLLNEYILVSPHRAKRPWLGQTETIQATNLPEYDPECYLCPGNARMGGQKNPVYEKTYTFENDFAAVLPTAPPAPIASHPLLTSKPVHGGCDVILFHPRHDLTLSRLGLKEIEHIVEEWIAIYKKRSQQEGIEYVQIFENKGAMMGCSNPHPHCQVWSQSDVPTLPATELASLARYAQSDIAPSGAPKGPGGKPCMLCEYAHIEMQNAETDGRVVVRNEHWVAVVPWWATWPFEILLLPFKRHIPAISDLSEEEKAAFAEILSQVTIRYDNLFSCMFAYSMGIHQRPTLSGDDIAHLHLHFAPPLLRSATVRKFLVGYELMAEAQRDLTPEQAAARLRGAHFKLCTNAHVIRSVLDTRRCAAACVRLLCRQLSRSARCLGQRRNAPGLLDERRPRWHNLLRHRNVASGFIGAYIRRQERTFSRLVPAVNKHTSPRRTAWRRLLLALPQLDPRPHACDVPAVLRPRCRILRREHVLRNQPQSGHSHCQRPAASNPGVCDDIRNRCQRCATNGARLASNRDVIRGAGLRLECCMDTGMVAFCGLDSLDFLTLVHVQNSI